jgi:hypothetical protein
MPPTDERASEVARLVRARHRTSRVRARQGPSHQPPPDGEHKKGTKERAARYIEGDEDAFLQYGA